MQKKTKTQRRNMFTAATITILMLVMLSFSSASYASRHGHNWCPSWAWWCSPSGPSNDGGGTSNKVPELNAGQLGLGMLVAVGGMLAMTGRRAKREK